MPSVSLETSPLMRSPAAELASALCVADEWAPSVSHCLSLSPYFSFWVDLLLSRVPIGGIPTDTHNGRICEQIEPLT